MFEYFPGNYVWNLGVVAALNSGGLIDEVDRACRPIRKLAAQGSDVGTAELMASWTAVVDDLQARAERDEAAGHRRAAGQQYFRATNYLTQAERMQSAHSPMRQAIYQRCLDLTQKTFDLLDRATTRVAIPFEGSSLPAYFTAAGRAHPAFEKRLALCVAWGANHDWGAVQKRRLEREGERPVPHYWDHVLWVWGETDLDTFIKKAEAVRLDGVVERITVPFLVVHGANDRQIPVADAHRSYDQAVNSPKRELRIFTPAEGGAEHIGLDHLPHVSVFIADWIAGEFA